MKRSRRIWTGTLCSSLTLTLALAGCVTTPSEVQALPPASTPSPPVPSPAVARARASAADLDQLVAPIALYPDSLVAQILAASTFPTEVVEAHRWMQQHPDVKGPALATAVDSQGWDPSVKALTQFPTVLAMMDANLAWTSALGDAYFNGAQDVLDAIQVMRNRAQGAGTLKSTPQESVASEGQTITIEPTDPEVVYVPEYDPWLVYGAPLALYPDWIGFPALYIDGPGVVFGVGIGIGVFGAFGWGWHHWGADWHGHDVIYDHHRYVSRSPTFDGRHAFEAGHGRLARPAAFPRGDAIPHTADFAPGRELRDGSPRPSAFLPRDSFRGNAPSGIRSSAFSGFNHGGVVSAFSSRGRASFAGGSHAGGFSFGGGHR